MVVEADPAQAPLGIFVGARRQRLERRAVELEEQVAAADAQAAHRPRIEVGDQPGDRLVELGQREEAAMAQAGQDPALDHEHRHLDLGLVARLAHPGRQDRRAVVRRHVEVGPVQPRLVPVGPIDADLRVVGHELARHAAHEGQRTRMGADPVRQRLRPGRLGVGVAGRAHRGDEHLRLTQLAGPPVDDLDRLPGIVDEQPLAGRVRPGAWSATAGPPRRGRARTSGCSRSRRAAAARYSSQSSISVTPGRRSSRWTCVQSGSVFRRTALPAAAAGEEQRLQHAVAQRLRQRPARPAAAKRSRVSATVLRATPSERAIARSVAPHSCFRRRISRTRRIDTLSAGIGSPALAGLRRTGAAHRPAVERPPPQGVADFRSEWPTSRRKRWPSFISESVADLARNQQSSTLAGVQGFLCRPPRADHQRRLHRLIRKGALRRSYERRKPEIRKLAQPCHL